MAVVNLSRKGNRHKKGGISVFQTVLTHEELNESNDTFQLARLPEKCLVVRTEIVSLVPFTGTSFVVDIGLAGGEEFSPNFNAKSAANTIVLNNTARHLPSGGIVTAKPTFAGAVNAGSFLVCIQYIEYTKQDSGEVTNFV